MGLMALPARGSPADWTVSGGRVGSADGLLVHLNTSRIIFFKQSSRHFFSSLLLLIKLTCESHAAPVDTIIQKTQPGRLGDTISDHLVVIKPGARLVEPGVIFLVFGGEQQDADASVSCKQQTSVAMKSDIILIY